MGTSEYATREYLRCITPFSKWDEYQVPYERTFWISPYDVVSTEDAIIDPGFHTMRVGFTSEHLPPIHAATIDNLLFVDVSTRSRLAQLGISFDSESVAWSLYEGFIGRMGLEAKSFQEVYQEIEHGRWFSFNAVVGNWNDRPVQIPKGFGVFRFYYKHAAKNLWDQDLHNAVEECGVRVDGEKGCEWEYVVGKTGHTVAINLATDRDSWRFFPNNTKDMLTHIVIPQESNHIQSRPLIDEYTVLRSKHNPPDGNVFWVCQSVSSVHIENPEIHGIVPSAVLVREEGERLGFFVPHTSSQLIESGSNWPIRFEIEAKKEDLPTFIRLDLYKG